jgi:hypothetical protein
VKKPVSKFAFQTQPAALHYGMQVMPPKITVNDFRKAGTAVQVDPYEFSCPIALESAPGLVTQPSNPKRDNPGFTA